MSTNLRIALIEGALSEDLVYFGNILDSKVVRMCIYVWYFFKNKTNLNLQIAPVNYNNNNNLFSRKKLFQKFMVFSRKKNNVLRSLRKIRIAIQSSARMVSS